MKVSRFFLSGFLLVTASFLLVSCGEEKAASVVKKVEGEGEKSGASSDSSEKKEEHISHEKHEEKAEAHHPGVEELKTSSEEKTDAEALREEVDAVKTGAEISNDKK